MAKQVINIGRTANDRSGDPLRTAFNKVNENFTELYAAVVEGINVEQIPADWNANTGVARILNKPTIPTNTNQLTNGAGFITVTDVPVDVSDLTDLTGLLNVANRLNNGFNNLEMALDELGTLNLDTLFPVVFTATVDAAHYAGEGSLTLEGNAWSFAINFAVVQNGTVSINITNNTPWSSNPGYANNMPFAFTEADHGIPGYTFTLTLVDIQNPGPFMYTTNLTASQAPALPSTFKSNNAVKLTAGLNSWAFGTNGNITLPLGGDILDSAGNSVLGSNSGGGIGQLTYQGTWNSEATYIAGIDVVELNQSFYLKRSVDGNSVDTPDLDLNAWVKLGDSPFDQNLNSTDSPQFNAVSLTLGEIDIAQGNDFAVFVSPDGVTSYGLNFSNTDGTLSVPNAITGFQQSEMNHRIVLKPNPTLEERFLLYVDQVDGSFLRAGMEMPSAQVNKASTLGFPHANGNVGYLYSQGNDTSGTEFNNAFNVMSNGTDLKLSAFNSDTRYIWTFGTDGKLTLPGSITRPVDQDIQVTTVYSTVIPGQTITADDNQNNDPSNFIIVWIEGSGGTDYPGITAVQPGWTVTGQGLDNDIVTAVETITYGPGMSAYKITTTTVSPKASYSYTFTGPSTSGVGTKSWTFDTDGTLTFPGQSQIITSEGGSDALILKGPALGYVDLRGSILIGHQQSDTVAIGNPNGGTLLELLAEQVKFLGQAVPTTSKGATGDVPGLIAMDNFYIYYCIGTYSDGLTDIWKRVQWSADTW